MDKGERVNGKAPARWFVPCRACGPACSGEVAFVLVFPPDSHLHCCKNYRESERYSRHGRAPRLSAILCRLITGSIADEIVGRREQD